ncbi:MAG: polysaccharide deacetylase family protein [Oscillospiraceae bacterium]|nr:polysaccharide deacetylase family protein [Oscillospiraceae bacterium]
MKIKFILSLLGILILLTACSNKTTDNNEVIVTTEKAGDPRDEIMIETPDPLNSAGLSTEKIEYGFGVAKDEKPNELSINNQKLFDKYSAFCLDMKSKDKVLYLTFDCGYENGYTAPILDILKDKKVNATFFVTLDYLKSEEGEKMATRMIKEGHNLGNHSSKHPSFPSISRSEMTNEIETCENYMRTKFGYSSDYFRFPAGEYSICALDLVNKIGFKSVFWSIAYLDYDTNNQPSSEKAMKTLTSRLHPGAIILLHSVSSTNADILDDFIDEARAKGYTFKSLDEFPVK